MTVNDNIIDQANKLMRRRVFVASGALPATPPTTEPAPNVEADDLPVLTEVFTPAAAVAAVEVEPPPPVVPQELIDARAQELMHAQLPFQRQAVADEIAAWLDSELPQVVMRVLDGLTDQIIGRVTEEAKAVLVPRLQDALEVENIPFEGDD